MFKILISPIIISLVLSCFIYESTGYFRIENLGIRSCEEDSTYFGYCQDCLTSKQCSGGLPLTTENCTETQSCVEDGKFSACETASTVDDCYCSPGEDSQKPDPYNNTNFIVCRNGERYPFTCPNGGIYDETTSSCGTEPTSPPDTGNCPDERNQNIVVSYNCTCSLFCFADGTESEPSCCPLGETFNNNTVSCEKYEFISCADKDDGRYGDPHNCSKYFTCVDEEIFGSEGYCGESKYFDDDTKTCETVNTNCKTTDDCGVCPFEGPYFEIEGECTNYYVCEKNDEDSPPYVPVLHQCLEGTCFSQETGYCQPI